MQSIVSMQLEHFNLDRQLFQAGDLLSQEIIDVLDNTVQARRSCELDVDRANNTLRILRPELGRGIRHKPRDGG